MRECGQISEYGYVCDQPEGHDGAWHSEGPVEWNHVPPDGIAAVANALREALRKLAPDAPELKLKPTPRNMDGTRAERPHAR